MGLDHGGTNGAPILTPDQRIRVFVSSTLQELAPERTAAREAVEALRFVPVLFESGARPHPPRALYRAYLDQSHVFVGIYWQSYGWVAPGSTVSGIEDEYEHATGKPKLVYVKAPAGEREPRLESLLDRFAGDGVSYRRFETPRELGELLRDDLALLVSERLAQVLRSERGRQVVIPAPVSSFVGREDDLGAIEELLRGRETRLVTLVGPGGIGKTRLAIEAARRTLDTFCDGVVTVLLASLRDPGDVVPAIARAVGVSESSGTRLLEALRAYLDGRELLLVLDNLEHLLDAAPAVAELLASAPGLSVLATSRTRLGIGGEHCYLVPPLGLPASGAQRLEELERSDAVRLFQVRVEASGWRTSEGDAMTIAEVVRRLDGLPLAIELAAAQARLGPAELVHTRLHRRLDLGGAPRDAAERHRTLRSTIAWSYDLLDEPARRFFAGLSVFAGGFTLDAAAAVADPVGEADELLASLVDASLVHVEPSRATGGRFGMLETIREYAGERLDEYGAREAVAARHLAYFACLADEAYDVPIEGRFLVRARLDEELANFRSALSEAMRRDPDQAVRLAGELGHLWSFRGLAFEGRDTIGRALAAAPDAPVAWRARALLAGAWLAAEQDDYADADRRALEACELFRALGDARRLGEALKMLGWSAECYGDTERAIRYYGESYDALAGLPEGSLRAERALTRANWLVLRGQPEEARRTYAEALEHLERQSLDDERAIALLALGAIDDALGERRAARRAFEEGVALSRKTENPRHLAWALLCLGHIDTVDGQLEEAAGSYDEALEVHRNLGDRRGVASCLERVAPLALAVGSADVAAELLGAAHALRTQTHASGPRLGGDVVAQAEAAARLVVGDEEFARLEEAGASLHLPAAVELARGLLAEVAGTSASSLRAERVRSS